MSKVRRNLITEDLIANTTKKITQGFNPEKIILFGSYAYGKPTADSDVDFLVVLPFEGRNFYKSLEILDYIDPRFPMDLLARRPEDVTRQYQEYDPLIREALDHGKVLYERHS